MLPCFDIMMLSFFWLLFVHGLHCLVSRLIILFTCINEISFTTVLPREVSINLFLTFILQNLREAIATYRNSILHQPDEMKREASLSFFVEYLERYYFLICFAVYLHTEETAVNPSFPAQCSFSDWMRARPELYSILRRYLF